MNNHPLFLEFDGQVYFVTEFSRILQGRVTLYETEDRDDAENYARLKMRPLRAAIAKAEGRND